MGYTALYRKWRSRNFDEVKGQAAVTESLRNQVRIGRIGHAYLFCGTRGTGKTSVAKILARAANCQNPENGNPCNACASCLSILGESSMNVVEMDAASNNGVDDIRQIREQVEYPPVDARYKVYIIDEVHMLSTSAFNAFLKTLEEPPDYVIFVLATTEPNKIPITILSRCQRYDFKRIPSKVIAERLREIADAEQIDISDEALYYIARVGDGSMRDSVSLLDQCTAYLFDRHIGYEEALDVLGAVDTGVFSALIRASAEKDARTILKLVADMAEQGRELAQFVGDFLHYARDMLMAKSVEDLDGLVDMSAEDLARLREDSARMSMEELLRAVRMLSELSNQLRYASQKRVLVETSLLKLAYPESDASIEGVSARISILEREMGQKLAAMEAMLSAVPEGGIGRQEAGASQDMQGVQNLQTAQSASSPLPAERTFRVALPKAQYEDLEKLRGMWGEIASAMPHGLTREAMRKSFVRPDRKSGGMILSPEDKASYRILSDEEKLQEITEAVTERLGKEVLLRVEMPENQQEKDTVYVTDDDLRRIHAPIEMVEQEEGLL